MSQDFEAGWLRTGREFYRAEDTASPQYKIMWGPKYGVKLLSRNSEDGGWQEDTHSYGPNQATYKVKYDVPAVKAQVVLTWNIW